MNKRSHDHNIGEQCDCENNFINNLRNIDEEYNNEFIEYLRDCMIDYLRKNEINIYPNMAMICGSITKFLVNTLYDSLINIETSETRLLFLMNIINMFNRDMFILYKEIKRKHLSNMIDEEKSKIN